MNEKTVLVLGAGFTKAFFPAMPLLRDDQLVVPLADTASRLPAAGRVLDAELQMTGGGWVDVERLMTRLDSGAPFDRPGREQAELRVMLAELKTRFADRLTASKGDLDQDLMRLAAVIIRDAVSCITFNYDDVLDEHLYKVRGRDVGYAERDYWDPDSGYGFACRDVESFLGGDRYEPPDVLLLKLHGSVNWRILRGYPSPFPLNAIVRLQLWHPLGRIHEELAGYDDLLEREPLIVPPVMMKRELQVEPLFQLVWSRAYAALAEATQVVFVGYSLPVTDLAARSLFSEAIRKDSKVTVVTRGQGRGRRSSTIERYRDLWPQLDRSAFEFRDARSWAREFSDRAGANLPSWYRDGYMRRSGARSLNGATPPTEHTTETAS